MCEQAVPQLPEENLVQPVREIVKQAVSQLALRVLLKL